MNRYPAKPIMDQMAQHGRYGDTMLVHMNPIEVAGIASLTPGGKLTTNPVTGQPEAFLPLLFGALGGALKLGTLGTAALSGIGTAAVTGDIKRGLLAGLTSGLTAGIGEAFTGADAAADAVTSAPVGIEQALAQNVAQDGLSGSLQSVVQSGGDIMSNIGAAEASTSAGLGVPSMSQIGAGEVPQGIGQLATPDPTISQQIFGGAETAVNKGIGALGTSGQLVGAMTAEGMSQQMQTQQDFERQQRAMREESEGKRMQAYNDLQGAYAMAQPGLQTGYSPYRSMMSRNTPLPSIPGMNEGGIVPSDEEAKVLAMAGNQGILGSEDQMTLEGYYNNLNAANATAIEEEAAAAEAEAGTLFIEEGSTNQQALQALQGAGLVDQPTYNWFQKWFGESKDQGNDIANGKYFASNTFPGTEAWLATTDFADSSKEYIRSVMPLIQQGATTGIPLNSTNPDVTNVTGLLTGNPFGSYGGGAFTGYGGLDPVQVQANLRGKEPVSAPRDYMTGFEPEFSYYQEDASRPITPDRSYRPTSQQIDSTGEYFDPIINREEYLQQIKDYYATLGGYTPDPVEPVDPVDPNPDVKPGDPCEMPDGTPGVINNSGVCHIPDNPPLGGQPCTMPDGSAGITDDDGICQLVDDGDPKPGDPCTVDGQPGTIDENGVCKINTGAGPNPGDPCTVDGQPGTIDENGVCQITETPNYGGYGDPLKILNYSEIDDYITRMIDVSGVEVYGKDEIPGLSGQEQGAQDEKSDLVIRDLFYRYLGREPDKKGLNFYSERLIKNSRFGGRAATRTLRSIAEEIMGSEEGQNYATGIQDGTITPPDRTKPDGVFVYTNIDEWMAGKSGSKPFDIDTTPDEDGYLSPANYRDIDEFLHRRRNLLLGVDVLMDSKKSVSASDLNDVIASQPTRYGGQMVYNPDTGRLYEGVSDEMSQAEQNAFYENIEEARDQGNMPYGINPDLYTDQEKVRGAGLNAGTTGNGFIRVGNEQYFVDPSDNSVVSYTVKDIPTYGFNSGMSGGGTVPLRTPVGNAEVTAGGIANVPTEFSASMPTEEEFNMIKDAVLGRIENADAVVDMFVKKYGPEMFQQLRNMLLRSSQPEAQTEGMIRGNGSGMDDEVPGMIGDQQPVAVSPGEFIVPADVVSGLGDGSSDAGAKELDQMMERVRMARGGTTKQAPSIDANGIMPA